MSINTSNILGNASEDIKRLIGIPHQYFQSFSRDTTPTFGNAISERLRVTEISIIDKPEEPTKLEGRVVIEIEVSEGAVQPRRVFPQKLSY